MKYRNYIVLLLFLLLKFTTSAQAPLLVEDFSYPAGSLLTDHGWSVTPPERTDFKVLFVGNSYTYYNDGVDFHLQKMLNADPIIDSVYYKFQEIAVGSYTLLAHYEDPLTLAKIRSDNWNIVVLQEQSTRPINNPDLFLEYAGKFDNEIKKMNARTVLYMTWAPQATPTDIDQLAASYISVGQQLNVQVVPVGKVWEYIIKNYPQFSLYISDGKHPTLTGTYIIAYTFYFSLLGRNPITNTYVPSGISSTNAIIIRKAVYDYMQLNK